jgi:hypothetical protein
VDDEPSLEPPALRAVVSWPERSDSAGCSSITGGTESRPVDGALLRLMDCDDGRECIANEPRAPSRGTMGVPDPSSDVRDRLVGDDAPPDIEAVVVAGAIGANGCSRLRLLDT